MCGSTSTAVDDGRWTHCARSRGRFVSLPKMQSELNPLLEHPIAIALFAQVGSGFDVSAAVYGTHTYTRFSPSELADALSAGDAPSSTAALPESAQDLAGNSPPLERIAKCVRARGGWDAERGQLRLPSCFRLLMGDVCGGSSTPSMVRKVGRVLETTLFVFCGTPLEFLHPVQRV